MGSDKYFKLRDVNQGPRHIADQAKQKFEDKMVGKIDEVSEAHEQLMLWGEYEQQYGANAQAQMNRDAEEFMR